MENKKDIPKLIEIAKLKLKTPIKKRVSSESSLEQVRLFIEENNIRPHGSICVPGFVIYHKYSMWCKLNNVKQSPKASFFNKFKLYFNSKVLSGVRQYYINPEGFDLSIQNLEFIKNEEKKTKKKS